MTIYPNLFIPLPWDFIILYFPLKHLVYFGHCGKALRSSYCILAGPTLPPSNTCNKCHMSRPDPRSSVFSIHHFMEYLQEGGFVDAASHCTAPYSDWYKRQKPMHIGRLPSRLLRRENSIDDLIDIFNN